MTFVYFHTGAIIERERELYHHDIHVGGTSWLVKVKEVKVSK